MGRQSNDKKRRREDRQRANPWATPNPVPSGDPQEVVAKLQEQMAHLEATRHAIHANDKTVMRTAQAHHDRHRDAARQLGDELAHDPDDTLADAQGHHLMERRGAEEVHREMRQRVGAFRPKI